MPHLHLRTVRVAGTEKENFFLHVKARKNFCLAMRESQQELTRYKVYGQTDKNIHLVIIIVIEFWRDWY